MSRNVCQALLAGIVAASMSTSDGAILALGTVFSHNIMRHVPKLLGMKAGAYTRPLLSST